MVNCVVGFLKSGGDILLVQKIKPSWQKGFYNGVGGKIEEGETPIEAMHREWKEETIDGRPQKWEEFATLNFDGVYIHFFVAQDDTFWFGWWQNQNDIGEKFCWFPEESIPTSPAVVKNLQWLVPLSADKNNFTAFIKKDK